MKLYCLDRMQNGGFQKLNYYLFIYQEQSKCDRWMTQRTRLSGKLDVRM